MCRCVALFCPIACHFAAVISQCFLWLDLTHLYSRRVQSLQSKVHIWRVDVLCCEDSRYFVEGRVVKAVPSCGGDHFLHRQCSRVARFDDIFYFGFWCNSSLFFSSVMHRVNSPNATTLNSRCIWEGVLRYSSQGFFPLVSPMYSIYSPYWASIVQSSSVSLYS